MTTFTHDERMLLATLPQSIGSAVAFAGSSGLFGTGKELFVNAQALLAGAKDHPDNALIRSLVPDITSENRGEELAQAREARDWAVARMKDKGINSQEKFTEQALEDARTAAGLLARATPEEAAGYRAWVMSVAEKVANASTEGGFLGFGGERLSEGEKAVIAQIKTALG